jgi:hypothetical protein
MPHVFSEHRDGSGLTIQLFGHTKRNIDIVGPIPDDEHARTLRAALDKLERVLARLWLPPRVKEQSRGRLRQRPKEAT